MLELDDCQRFNEQVEPVEDWSIMPGTWALYFSFSYREAVSAAPHGNDGILQIIACASASTVTGELCVDVAGWQASRFFGSGAGGDWHHR